MNGGKKSLQTSYDVVIVGSGPAGASAAKALSGRGLGILIMEAAKLKRYKMCSGILFPSARKFIEKHFGVIPEQIFCQPVMVKGSRVRISKDTPYEYGPFSLFDEGEDLPEDGFNTIRSELDYWLCCQSDAQIVDECRFKSVSEQEGMGMVVVADLNGEKIEVQTRFLIGADGPMSSVRKSIAPGFDDNIRQIPNYEEWYEGNIDLEPGYLYIDCDRSITGYFATVFHKDGKIIVVTGAKKGESVKDYFAKYVQFLKEKHGLTIDKTVKSCGCILHDMSATDNYFFGTRNSLLAGEAGGFNRCAEGITAAMITGRAAGESVLKSMDTGSFAYDFYPAAVAPEREACNRTSAKIEAMVGVNPFTRD
jgi:menaquinone-9 beta-reductase